MSVQDLPRLSAPDAEHPDGSIMRRLPIQIAPRHSDVITLPFLGGGAQRLRLLYGRIARLREDEVLRLLDEVCRSYRDRHLDLPATFRQHYHAGLELAGQPDDGWSDARKQLCGAYLTMEYSIDAAALFNPSVVPHPDQTGLPSGDLRFVLSLRATGEGHVSSIVFRTGVITSAGEFRIDPTGGRLIRGRIRHDQSYDKALLTQRLREMNALAPSNEHVLAQLPDHFGLRDFLAAAERSRGHTLTLPGGHWAVDTLVWLVRSNYHIDLPPDHDLRQLVIFPTHEHESRGLEDLRLVRFIDDNGSATYFGTYTAYNGVRILPMLLQTRDFRSIESHSLNGRCATNKGMALFPRRIAGHYVMCSRIDGENLYLSLSDYVHFWESAKPLAVPVEPWEMRQLGNCGSPIQTPEGWLLITHGVGPMRTYCIGAMLLDLDDPTKVLGQLERPMLSPRGHEREGYVPNVVYSCGALLHNGLLYLPYAQADRSTSVAVAELDALLNRLLDRR